MKNRQRRENSVKNSLQKYFKVIYLTKYLVSTGSGISVPTLRFGANKLFHGGKNYGQGDKG